MRAVVDAIGFNLGMAHVEIILTGEGRQLVEINPRPMGGDLPRLFEAVTGRSVYDDLLHLHLHRSPTPAVPPLGAASCRKVQARRHGVSHADPWPELLRVHAPSLRLLSNALQPDRRVEAGSVVARFMVTAGDVSAAEELADEILREVTAATGIDAEPPEPFACAHADGR